MITSKEIEQYRVGEMNDRRRKLTPQQRKRIKLQKGNYPAAVIAEQFGVSIRTVRRIWFPDKAKKEAAALKKNKPWRKQYSTVNSSLCTKRHRQYKKSLLEKKNA